MARKNATHPQILTANRLLDGEVVYRTGNDWCASIDDADVFALPAQAGEAQILAATETHYVVDPYLFEVRMPERHPITEREVIRSKGPSVRDDLGKQAG